MSEIYILVTKLRNDLLKICGEDTTVFNDVFQSLDGITAITAITAIIEKNEEE